MNNVILFEEVQGASSSTVKFFRITGFLFVFGLIFNFIRQHGTITNSTQILVVGTLICGIVVMMGNIKMTTIIKEDAIYVSYKPFQPRFVKFEWTNIQSAYIRNVNPLVEYRGWGIKEGPMGRGYLVAGNAGLQLQLKDGQMILIGTQKPEEMEEAVKKMIS